MKLLIATRNANKLEEIRALFDVAGIDLVSPDDMPGLPEVVEDGDTLEANAIKKAVTLARAAECWALADDSGLLVDTLDGAPGVYSARYAGPDADYAANNAKLLDALSGAADRRAHFACVVALSSPAGDARTVEGRCEGAIATAPRGQEGFGYDPLFVPEGYRETFAEMPAELKHSLSHRGQALRAAREQWDGFLAREPGGW